MRITCFADIRFPIERANGIQTLHTCRALAERGHDVILVVRADTAETARDPYRFYDVRPVKSLRIVSLPVMGPPMARRFEYVVTSIAYASRRRRGIVFTRDLGLATFLNRLPRWSRGHVVYESHGIASIVAAELPRMLGVGQSPSAGKLARLERRERVAWKTTDGYVCITAQLAGALQREFGSRTGPTTVIPDGACIPRSSQWKDRTNHPIVLYAGHLYPWKGVDDLVHAIHQLRHVHLEIVGGHPQESDVQRVRTLVSTLGIEHRVRFHGMVEPGAVAPLLGRADVLVLPNPQNTASELFTSPLKLFEYMAAGRPIVASDLPAIREVLRPDQNAVLFAPGDAAAMASAIARVIEDSELARMIARTAFEEASQYSWERRAERLESFFITVLAT